MVMVSTLASRLLGFLRIAVIGALFGASGEADVLNLVFNIPNNLRKLLAEGALSSAFLPVLTRSHSEDPQGNASRRLVRQLIGFQIVVLVPLLLLATIFARPVVQTILAFPEVERQILAAQLFRWLIHYVLIISIAAVLMGTLNSHHRFVIPAVAPLLFSVGVIGSIVLLHRYLGIFSMVAGVLIGGLGQLVIQIPGVVRSGYTLAPLFSFNDRRFRIILRQWVPVLSTASIFAIDQQVALFFASGLRDGSGSALTNALVFWQLPFGIFGASITTVLFPLMSRQHGNRDVDGLRHSVQSGLRALALLLIPAAGALFVLGEPMIAVALQRGAFTPENTALAARVLRGYSVGLFSVGSFTFLQRYFYATEDYRTPLAVAVVTMTIDVVLSYVLKETALEVAGLAVANSLAFSAGLAVVLVILARRLGARSITLAGPAVVRAVAASAGAVVAVYGVRALIWGSMDPWWLHGSSMENLLRLLVEGFTALAVLIGVYRLLGISIVAVFRRPRSAGDGPSS